MDLTKTAPRSAKDRLLGLVSLKRAIDKAKAYKEGTLGEYDYNCPHDKPLFDFLGTNGEEFAGKVQELQTDDAIAQWIQTQFLSKKTPDEIARFNNERIHWHPEDAEHQAFFNSLRDKIAPERTDVVTWFDLLDLDEKRPVAQATQLTAV